MDFGLEYNIFHLIGHSEDHGRLIKKIDHILRKLPNSSKCPKGEMGGVEQRSELEQAFLADFDFAELVDPSLDLELLELPENFLGEEACHNSLFGPEPSTILPDNQHDGVRDDADFAMSSGCGAENVDANLAHGELNSERCGDKRPSPHEDDGQEKEANGNQTPPKRIKRTRKMSLDLEWGYCPFDELSGIPPSSLEKMDDRLSPFEDVDQKGLSSALAYLQRNSGRKKSGRVESKKTEERSRKSARHQRVAQEDAVASSTSVTSKRSPSGAMTADKSPSVQPSQPVHEPARSGGSGNSPVGGNNDSGGTHSSYRNGTHLDDSGRTSGSGTTMQSRPSVGIPFATAPDGSALMSFGPGHMPKDGKCKMVGIYDPEARLARVARFHEKRRSRVWRKKIKYDCRKKLADDRPRIKGRFVKCSVPDKPATTAQKPSKEAGGNGLFRSSSTVPGDFKYRSPGMGSGPAYPGASRPMYRPTAGGNSKAGSLPSYNYPYPSGYGSASNSSASGAPSPGKVSLSNGTNAPPGYRAPVSTVPHQRQGAPGPRPPSFAQQPQSAKKNTTGTNMDREQDVAKTCSHRLADISVSGDGARTTGMTSSPAFVAVAGKSTPCYRTSTEGRSDAVAPNGPMPFLAKAVVPSASNGAADRERAGSIGSSKTTSKALPPSSSAMQINFKKTADEEEHGKGGRSPNSTLSPPIETMGMITKEYASNLAACGNARDRLRPLTDSRKVLS